MDREETERASGFPSSLGRTMRSPKVWALGLVNFGLLVGLYTINFWMPQIVKGLGVSNTMSIGFITALPALAGAIGMIFWTRHSDRSGERTWHLVGSILVGVTGFTAVSLTTDPVLSVTFLVLASLGIHSALPLFWTLPTAFLSGVGSAAGLALINSISNLGGYVGPQLMGYIKDQTTSFAPAFAMIAMLLVFTAGVVLAIHATSRVQLKTLDRRPEVSRI